MDNQEKVCAVVVTFNRKDLLMECLNSLLNQTKKVDTILIVDNFSTDGTEKLLLDNNFIDKLPPENIDTPFIINSKKANLNIKYIKMNENTGGAGGFHMGTKTAYEDGFDWIWLMDDDGIPDSKCLNNLLLYKKDADFLAPLVIDIEDETNLSFGIQDNNITLRSVKEITKETYLNTASPFNGILLSNKLVQSIGYPKKDMFIWGDEFEYFTRILNSSFKILTISNAIHRHPRNRVITYKIFNDKNIYFQNTPLKDYCLYRNYAYVNYNLRKKTNILKDIIKYSAFFIKRFEFNNLFFFLSATFDGVNGNFSKHKKFLK
jgi:rhamnopyranosyl-N-acetylglucosaminyl-diphospho-decaprenol beta-1,3/1,4-galactofuranosyltransferase